MQTIFPFQVHCMCIPHIDQVKKIRSASGKPPMLIDGEEIFALQIRKLRVTLLLSSSSWELELMQFSHKQKLLEGLLERRMNMREGMGMLYSFHVWLLLFRLVLDRFDQKLRMAELLSLILKPNNRMVSIVYACPLPNYKTIAHFKILYPFCA